MQAFVDVPSISSGYYWQLPWSSRLIYSEILPATSDHSRQTSSHPTLTIRAVVSIKALPHVTTSSTISWRWARWKYSWKAPTFLLKLWQSPTITFTLLCNGYFCLNHFITQHWCHDVHYSSEQLCGIFNLFFILNKLQHRLSQKQCSVS